MGWKHYQTVEIPPPPPKKKKKRSNGEPQVGRGLFGVHLLILHLKIFQIHEIFNISYFPQFNLSFEKKYLCLKVTQTFAQNSQTVVNEISRQI